MKNRITKELQKRKRKIEKRLARKNYPDQKAPMFKANNLHYELSGKINAINAGGLGLFHYLLQKLGLDQSINARLKLLKQHKPYWESDHVFNLCENVVVGH